MPIHDGSALPFIVGVGASAGGLEALTQLLASVNGLTNMSFVIVQHLSADYKSMMPELLARHTEMEVVAAHDGTVPLPDTVYVIEPDTVLRFGSGRLCVQPAHKEQGKLFLPINVFFESLAAERHEQCAVIVLSGTGSDGSSGLRSAKSHGAVTICQQPDSARFDGMPRAAMATGAVDLVLTPDHMLPQLMQMRQEGAARYFSAASSHGEVAISRILSALRTHTGIDFNCYKPATVLRRVERRMRELGVEDTREYADRLFQDVPETHALRQELLIGVTRFLRDDGAIEAVRSIAIPRLLQRAQQAQLRLWVPACSTGEEAYSLAMLLQEGLDTLPTHKGFRLFASDVDPEAVERASAGEFSVDAAQQLPPHYLERYFTRHGEVYQVSKTLREKLVFSRHDILQDPPFSQIDMVSCRNLLIYLKPQIQDRVIQLLSAALKDEGLVWLGGSEVIGDRADQFETLETRWHIYAAKPQRKRAAVMPISGQRAAGVEVVTRRGKPDYTRLLLEKLQPLYAPPCLVLDMNYRLLYRYGELDALLRFPSGAVSFDVRDLLPESLGVLVTSLLNKAREGADVMVREVITDTSSGPRRFDMRARSLSLPDLGPLLALFFEGLREVQPRPEIQAVVGLDEEVRDRMGLLERELRQTRESLQATVEEVESSNEELQATNEELTAANEELQSTNEELQSVNEELHTVNAEYSEKLNELTALNQDLDRLFASVDVGILLLDGRLVIRRFNHAVAQYFNVLPHDVGRPLVHLSHRLRYPGLLDDCGQALRSPELPLGRQVTTVDERSVQVQLRGYDSQPHDGSTESRTLIMTITDITSAQGAQQQLSRLAAAVEHSSTMISVVDGSDRIVHANSAFASSVQRELSELQGMPLMQLIHPHERDRTREALMKARAGERFRAVTRALVGSGERFDLVSYVLTSSKDASVIRIAETLSAHFVPYDRDRAFSEPAPLGPMSYCLWSSLQSQRVLDPHTLDLLELSSEADFDLRAPERFAQAGDVQALRELILTPTERAQRGYRFEVLNTDPPRMVQIRLCPAQDERQAERLLVELAELPDAPRGYRNG